MKSELWETEQWKCVRVTGTRTSAELRLDFGREQAIGRREAGKASSFSCKSQGCCVGDWLVCVPPTERSSGGRSKCQTEF